MARVLVVPWSMARMWRVPRGITAALFSIVGRCRGHAGAAREQAEEERGNEDDEEDAADLGCRDERRVDAEGKCDEALLGEAPRRIAETPAGSGQAGPRP